MASSVLLTDLSEVAVAVTATESYDGTATVTFTATDYAPATVAVEIEAAPTQPDPAVELSVMPSALEIVTGESAELMLTATPTAMITIRSDSTEIASVAEAEFELQEGVETTINVSGGNVDTTTLTITATAAGHTDTMVSVAVNVIESLEIFAMPASVDLVAGASTQIDVSVSRLVGESVTVDIAATDGLSVASSVLLTDLNEVAVTVTATESYDGTATVTFTATDYALATVAVEIEAAPTQPDPAVELSVMPSALEIVTGERAELMLTATPTATITIRSDSTGIASVAASAARFELAGGAGNSTRINVFGVMSTPRR